MTPTQESFPDAEDRQTLADITQLVSASGFSTEQLDRLLLEYEEAVILEFLESTRPVDQAAHILAAAVYLADRAQWMETVREKKCWNCPERCMITLLRDLGTACQAVMAAYLSELN